VKSLRVTVTINKVLSYASVNKLAASLKSLNVDDLQVLSDRNEFLGLLYLILDPNINALSAPEPEL